MFIYIFIFNSSLRDLYVCEKKILFRILIKSIGFAPYLFHYIHVYLCLIV